jgi:hypothetical protein
MAILLGDIVETNHVPHAGKGLRPLLCQAARWWKRISKRKATRSHVGVRYLG